MKGPIPEDPNPPTPVPNLAQSPAQDTDKAPLTLALSSNAGRTEVPPWGVPAPLPAAGNPAEVPPWSAPSLPATGNVAQTEVPPWGVPAPLPAAGNVAEVPSWSTPAPLPAAGNAAPAFARQPTSTIALEPPPTLYAPTASAPKAPLPPIPPMVDEVEVEEDEATRVNIPEPEVLRSLTDVANTDRNMRAASFNDAVFPTTKASASDDAFVNAAVTVVRPMPSASPPTDIRAAVSPAVSRPVLPAVPPAATPLPPAAFASTYVMEPMRRQPPPAATAQIPIRPPARSQTVAMDSMPQPQQRLSTGFSATYALDPQTSGPSYAGPQSQGPSYAAPQSQAPSYAAPQSQDPRFMSMQGAGQPYGSYAQPPMNPEDISRAWPPNTAMQSVYTQPPAEPPKKRTWLFVTVALAVGITVIGVGLIVYTYFDSSGGPSAHPTVDPVPEVPLPVTPPPIVTAAPPPEPPAPPPVERVPEPPAPSPPVVPAVTTPNRPVVTGPRSAPVAPPAPKPVADPNAFNEASARARLATANGVLAACKQPGGATGPGSANVTFGTDGSVTGVFVNPPYGGTKEGDCVAGQFRRAKVNPFEGSPQTIRHSFTIP